LRLYTQYNEGMLTRLVTSCGQPYKSCAESNYIAIEIEFMSDVSIAVDHIDALGTCTDGG